MIEKLDIENLISNETIYSKNNEKLVLVSASKRTKIEMARYISINKEVAWLIGFFIAEGSKQMYSGIGIANREIELIEKFKRAIEKEFGVNSKMWRAYIKTPMDRKNLNKIEKLWKKKLDIEHIKANNTKKARQDIVDLRIHNTIFAIIFNKIVKKSLQIIKNNKDLTKSFLDGYEVGDGSILQRNGYLYGICITVKDGDMKDFLYDCFKELYDTVPRIRYTKGSFEISITGVHNMTNLILDGHFSSSKRQWTKLIKCYLRKQYTRSHMRYWSILMDSPPLLINEIADKTNRSHWSVRDALGKDTYFGLTKVIKKRVTGSDAPYFKFYSLSKRGEELIKMLNESREHEKEGFDTRCSRT
ncbi:LAGLIDADG family homing endonuclease [Candidatus Micrarchaeota archaeon]|nr:LAGLIDADG family homing endonuclease [Candidatus Micrarchaeota archaeon]